LILRANKDTDEFVLFPSRNYPCRFKGYDLSPKY